MRKYNISPEALIFNHTSPHVSKYEKDFAGMIRCQIFCGCNHDRAFGNFQFLFFLLCSME